MSRKCEVTTCDNPEGSSVSMHYGAHAICGTCLSKAIAMYIHLSEQELHYGKLVEDLEREVS